MKQRINGGTVTRLIIATAIVAVGILIFLRNGGYISQDIYSQIMAWPSILLVLGLGTLAAGNYVGGVILLGVGGYFSPLVQNIFSFDVTNYIWPVVLVVAGMLLAFAPLIHRRRRHCAAHNGIPANEDQRGYLRINNRFNASQHTVIDEYFEGAEIVASFSGVKLDLRRTNLREGETYIDVDFNLSGMELLVPDNWVIETPVEMTMAGIDEKRTIASCLKTESRLVIRGHMKMSGITLKN